MKIKRTGIFVGISATVLLDDEKNTRCAVFLSVVKKKISLYQWTPAIYSSQGR